MISIVTDRDITMVVECCHLFSRKMAAAGSLVGKKVVAFLVLKLCALALSPYPWNLEFAE
jgi:hypothetical protein